MALIDNLKNIRQKLFAPLVGTGSGFFTRWSNPQLDGNLLHRYTGYVYTCISAIAEDVAMINFQVYRKLDSGDLVETPNHSLVKLLDKPNPLMSKYQLMEMTQTHIELTGEAFWYMELGEETGKPKSFYVLPPDRMTPVIDRGAALPMVAGYVFSKENGQQIPLEPEEIVHFKMPNPWDPYRGYGTVEAGLTYVMTEKYASEYSRNYIYNNAMPAGIVSFKNTMDKDAFQEVKRQWKQEYGTIDKAGKTAFINGTDVSFTQVGSNLSQSALTELKQMTRDDIMSMFRVSKPILGIFEDVNLASAKTAQYVFMSRVIDPKMGRIVDTLQTLLERWSSPSLQYELGYESPVPEDVDDKIKLYQAGLNSWLTVNEIRTEEGQKPVDGGDVIYQPLNLIPIGNPPAPNAAKSGHKVIRRSVAKQTVEKTAVQRKENYRKELMGNQAQWSARFKSQIGKILDAQKQQILDNWKVEQAKTLDEYGFDDAEWNQEYSDQLTPLEVTLASEQGAIALAFAGLSDTEFTIDEKVRDTIAQRIERMATNFNAETKNLLIKTLQEGIGNNESIGQIKKRIETVFDESKGYRAERIARTETLYATNSAAELAYAQTGYVTKEEWFANGNACEYCEELNGTVVAITSSFAELGTSIDGINGGSYSVDYQSIDYPPAHPNCECTILPVIDE